MEKLRKIGAIVLAVMMIAAVGLAYATTTAEFQENNEEGVAGNWDDPDTERTQGDSINIKKEIIAFNPNRTTVHAPVVTYTYTVTPASVSDLTVTDANSDHESNTAVEAPVKAGITTGLVVTGTGAGTAGTATSATGTLVFNNTSTWTTDSAGDTNEYNINLDFSGVTFTQPGVYRYQIAETISATSYGVIAMENGNYDTVYLDVYVDGNLDIYGYVCLTENASVDTSTSTKINGFVDGTASDGSDKYYTYDLVLSKDVVNDTYAATNTAFPFTVFFNNSENYTSTFVIGQTAGTGSTGLDGSAATLTLTPPQEGTTLLSGVALVKDGSSTTGTTIGDVTFTGIPAGVDVDVYETNIATGVTYTVATSVTGGNAVTDNNVSWGSTPSSAVAQTTKADYESTKATVNTTGITATLAQSVDITNTMLLISPTGYVSRFAPYALILIGGIVLLIISRKHKKHTDEQ